MSSFIFGWRGSVAWDALVRGTEGDTQGVGGLCLPWGFHAVHTSTSGMSHNQTHWLLLNWPAGLSLAHLEASCLKTLPLQFTLALQLPTIVCPAIAQTRWLIPDAPLSPYHRCKNYFSCAAQWGQSGGWGPGSWQAAMTCRWEMLHLG